jgi:microcystin-dependent protein
MSTWLGTHLIAGATVVPVGSILPFAGRFAPDGWLLCNGQEVSRTTYTNLYAAIGTTYGTGDGSTTFNLPDCNGRFLKGGTAGVYNSESLPDAVVYDSAGYGAKSQAETTPMAQNGGGAIQNTDGKTVLVGSSASTSSSYYYSYGKLSATNSTYQDGAKVQPDNLEVSYIIKY